MLLRCHLYAISVSSQVRILSSKFVNLHDILFDAPLLWLVGESSESNDLIKLIFAHCIEQRCFYKTNLVTTKFIPPWSDPLRLNFQGRNSRMRFSNHDLIELIFANCIEQRCFCKTDLVITLVAPLPPIKFPCVLFLFFFNLK